MPREGAKKAWCPCAAGYFAFAFSCAQSRRMQRVRATGEALWNHVGIQTTRIGGWRVSSTTLYVCMYVCKYICIDTYIICRYIFSCVCVCLLGGSLSSTCLQPLQQETPTPKCWPKSQRQECRIHRQRFLIP